MIKCNNNSIINNIFWKCDFIQTALGLCSRWHYPSSISTTEKIQKLAGESDTEAAYTAGHNVRTDPHVTVIVIVACTPCNCGSDNFYEVITIRHEVAPYIGMHKTQTQLRKIIK